MAELRLNRIRQKLLRGETAICLYGIDDPDAVESVAALGAVDGFMIEIEVANFAQPRLSDMARAFIACHAAKLEQPTYRTLPWRTRSSKARRVSSRGVIGSK